MQVNTGYQTPDYSSDSIGPANPTKGKQKMKTVYPEITLRDDCAETLIKNYNAGDTFEAKVTFKMVEVRNREGATSKYGEDGSMKSVELEIQGIEIDGVEESTEETADDASGAVDKYLSSKSTSQEDDED